MASYLKDTQPYVNAHPCAEGRATSAGKSTLRCLAAALSVAVVTIALLADARPSLADTTEQSESASFYQDALKRLQEGNSAAAVIQLRNAIQRYPDNLDARLLLGRVYLDSGDGASAEKELRHVYEARPADEIQLLLAQALLLEQKYQEVLSLVDDKGASPALRSSKLIVRGQAQSGLKNFEEAEALFNEAASLAPQSAAGPLAMARLKLMRKDFVAADQQADAALQRDASSFDAWLIKSDIATSRGDIRSALAALDKADKAKPGDLRVQLGRAQAELRGGQLDAADSNVKRILEQVPGHLLAKYLQCSIEVARGNFENANRIFLEIEDKVRDYPPSLLLGGFIRSQTKQYAQAEVALSRYLAIDPDNVEARRLLALTQLRNGTAASAVETLQRLLDKNPNDAAAQQLLASAYLRLGKYSEAAEAFEQAAKFGNAAAAQQARASLTLLGTKLGLPGSPNAGTDVLPSDDLTKGTLLILELLKTGEYDAALQKAEQLKGAYPSNPLVENIEGAIYLTQGDDANARKHFEAALTFDPDFFPASANLDRLDVRAGDIAAVEKRMRERVAANPKDERALLRLTEFLAGQQRGGEAIALVEGNLNGLSQGLEARQALVRLYIAAKAADKAKRMLGDLVGIAPDNVSVQQFVAQGYIDTGDPKQAVDIMRSLVSKHPDDVSLKLALAQVQVSASLPEDARVILEDVRRTDPGNVAAVAALINLALAANKPDDAIQYARDLAPADRIKSAQLEASVLERTKRADEAVAVLDKAFQQDAVSALAVDLGSAQLNAGRIDQAIDGLRRWLQQNQTDAAVRSVLGAALLRKGDHVGAAREYDKLVGQDPFNAVTLNNLAWLRDELGVAGAVDLAKRAHSLAPKSGEIADTLGWLLIKAKNTTDGLKLLREAAAATPANSDIQFHLAYALHQVGDDPGALKILLALLATDEQFSERAAAESLLSQLRS